MEQIQKIFQQVMRIIFADIEEDLNDSQILLKKIILSVATIFIWYTLTHSLNKLYVRKIENTKVTNVIVSSSNFVFGFLFLALFSTIWITLADSVVLFLLLIVVIGAFSIKGLFSNIMVWLLLLRKKYFKLYDRVEIDDNKGIITKITPLYFEMMELGHWFDAESPTGRVIHMPNQILLQKPVFNYNGLLKINWKEVEYTIRADSNWEKALQILTEISNDHVDKLINQRFADKKKELQHKMDLFDGKVEPVNIVDVAPVGITLKVRFPVYYTEGTATKSKLNMQVLKRFDKEPDIEWVGSRLHITEEK